MPLYLRIICNLLLSFQNGIYYKQNSSPGNSFAILFLKANNNVTSIEIGRDISSLWTMLMKLEHGTVYDLPVFGKNIYSGNLSTLIGYSPNIFSLEVQKEKPKNFNNFFKKPNEDPNRRITNEISLQYDASVTDNLALNCDIVIQFIADNQASTNRAIFETWRYLNRLNKTNLTNIGIMGFYTGFNTPDGRNLLYFHDGVSNIRSEERPENIFIDQSKLSNKESWLYNSTFMSFLRIAINIELWENLPRKYQERVIGRDKITGCPLIGINKQNENIVIRDCPVNGTNEIIEKGNELFRGFNSRMYSLFQHYSSKNESLENSHLQRMLQNEKRTPNYGKKIYRQGYNYIESIDKYPFLRIGLNFVSFQKDLDVLFNSLKSGFGSHDTNLEPFGNLTEFLSVFSAGLFLIPSLNKNDQFPGESIFNNNINNDNIKFNYKNSI